MRYAFVSHANLDKPRIGPLLDYLLYRGIPLWIDSPEQIRLKRADLLVGRIETGTEWDLAIRRACEAACCVLFLLSENSNHLSRSDQLFREFDCAIGEDKLVLAKIDNIAPDNLQGAFRIRQAIDLTCLPNLDRQWDVRDPPLELLISSIQSFLFADDALPNDFASLKSGIDGLAEMVRLIGNDLGDPVSAAAFKRAHEAALHEDFDAIREMRLRRFKKRPVPFTYFDIFNNICLMVGLRQDASMAIRAILKNPNPTQEAINETCSTIFDTLSSLNSLIGDFYRISIEIKDERYLRLPISMHKMMSETRFAIDAIIKHLEYDQRTRQNDTKLFTDAQSRILIEEFCDHLEKTVKFLCELSVDESRVHHGFQ